MSDLRIGTGLQDWISRHQATPLGDEVYDSPNFAISNVPILIGNAAGDTVLTSVGWSKEFSAIIPPGPGIVVPKPTPPAPVPTAAMTMYDSTEYLAIPKNAPLVAGYVNGAVSQWPSSAWGYFTNLVVPAFRITVDPRLWTRCDVLDIESGDGNPIDAAPWVIRRKALGLMSWLYANGSDMVSVQHNLDQSGLVAGQDYKLWLADPAPADFGPGTPHSRAGFDAVQYAWPEYNSGGHFDLSLVEPSFLDGHRDL